MTAEFGGPCTNDDECVIVRATGTCPVAGPFALPDEPIVFANVSAASEFVDDNARSLCPSEECAFPTFDNFYVAAVCAEGRCQGVVADPAVICGDLANRVNNAASDADDALVSPCSTDADCTTVTPTWTCPEFGHDVTGCPIVVAVGQSVAVDDSAFLAESCVDHPFDCVITAECGEVVPRCVAGECTP